jgi:hypothetical protein
VCVMAHGRKSMLDPSLLGVRYVIVICNGHMRLRPVLSALWLGEAASERSCSSAALGVLAAVPHRPGRKSCPGVTAGLPMLRARKYSAHSALPSPSSPLV